MELLRELDTGSAPNSPPDFEAKKKKKSMLDKPWYCNDDIGHMLSLGPKRLFSIG